MLYTVYDSHKPVEKFLHSKSLIILDLKNVRKYRNKKNKYSPVKVYFTCSLYFFGAVHVLLFLNSNFYLQ